MKPTVRSTAITFLGVGIAALVFGLTGFPQPLVVVAGAAAVLAGGGLFLRIRRAWTLAACHALVTILLAAYRLYHGITHDGGVVFPAVQLAVGAYLMVSLLAIRPSFLKG